MSTRVEERAAEGMAEIADLYGLAPLQAGMLYHTLAAPRRGTYVVQYASEITGEFDPSAFRAAWSRAFERHEVLRTAFAWEGLDEPLQAVRESVELPWAELDWRDLDPAEQERRLESVLEEDRANGFALDLAPLVRLRLIRTGASTWRFLWSFHHALLDGWSAVTLLQEVYRATADPSHDAPRPRPFRDYIDWLAGQDLDAARRAWVDRLADAPDPTRLAGGRLPGSETVTPGDRRTRRRRIDEPRTAALQSFARHHRLTLATLIHGAWSLTLSRHAGSRRVVYGATVAGRPAGLTGVESMIGLFINTLPVHVRLAPDEQLLPWLRSLQDELLEIRSLEHTPLPSIGEWTGIGTARASFESLLVFESSPDADAEMSELGFDVRDVRYLDQSDYPLAVLVFPGPALELTAVYDGTVFDEATVDALLANVESALDGFVAPGAAALKALPPPDAESEARLVALGTGEETTGEASDVLDRFYEHASRDPEAPAIAAPGVAWTYGELAERVRATAVRLREVGVGSESTIGVLAERSPGTIQAILACLEVGASYVPIAPDDPADRREHLLREASADLLLAADTSEGPDVAAGVRILPVSEGAAANAQGRSTTETTDRGTVVDDRLAYVLYTSGSTGRPKGVGVTRANLAYSTGVRDRVYETSPTRFLLVSPLTFDSSVVGLFWPLATGGAIVLPAPGEERDPTALAETIRAQRVTHTLCVPALWSLVLDAVDPSKLETLRTVIVAGEACPGELATRHGDRLPRATLYNEYGPTEATVWASAYRVAPDFVGASLPIGRPLPGSRLYLLDPDGRLSPEGAAGEICIAGPGVAPGYVSREDLTRDRFFPDPRDPEGVRRVYRTGDLGRWTPSGDLLFLGRRDEQIKVGGRRVEPGEIEAALLALPGVREAVVLADAMGENPRTAGANRLVAYVVPDDAAEPEPERLRAELRLSLPAYMVPAEIVCIPEVPRGRNGKVDRARLPELREGRALVGESPVFDPLEVQLMLIWERVLETQPIHLDDDFFDLGGHSLLAVRLLNEIEDEIGRRLPLATFLQMTTVRSFARALRDDGWSPPYGSLVTMQPEGTERALFVVHSFEGHVFFYSALAHRMAPDHPVFGLQAPGLDGIERPLARVDELTDLHLREIRRVRPHGPYTIAAMCFGVAGALELTARLRAEGEEVELVFLDSVLDGHEIMHRVDPASPLRLRVAHRARNHARLLRERMRRFRREHRPRAYARREQRMRLALIEAWNAYRAREVGGTITLIRSEANASDPAKDWQVESLASLTGAEIDVHIVPGGDHFSFLREPNVRIVADLIKALG